MIFINTYIIYLYFNSLKLYIININNKKLKKFKNISNNKKFFFYALFCLNIIFNIFFFTII